MMSVFAFLAEAGAVPGRNSLQLLEIIAALGGIITVSSVIISGAWQAAVSRANTRIIEEKVGENHEGIKSLGRRVEDQGTRLARIEGRLKTNSHNSDSMG